MNTPLMTICSKAASSFSSSISPEIVWEALRMAAKSKATETLLLLEVAELVEVTLP